MESASNDDLRLVELHFDSLREMRSVLANHVSPEGLFLEGEVSFEISELLRIRAVLPEDFMLFEAVGVVLWVDRLPQDDGEGPLGTAVRWITLDERGRTVVEDLVGGPQRQAVPTFELTPHMDSTEQLPSDAFDATPAPRESAGEASSTGFKFTIRGDDAATADPPEVGFGSDPVAREQVTEGFDPDMAVESVPVEAPVFQPDVAVEDPDVEALEWIEPDANPIPAGQLVSSPAAAGFGDTGFEPQAPVLAEVDLPKEAAPTEEARRLEEAARALDEESFPLGAEVPATGASTSEEPTSGSVLPPEHDWVPIIDEALPAAEAAMLDDGFRASSGGASPGLGELTDIQSVFEGLSPESEDDTPSPADYPPPVRNGRGPLVSALLVVVVLVAVSVAGWYWWNLQGGRTGVAVLDDMLGLTTGDQVDNAELELLENRLAESDGSPDSEPTQLPSPPVDADQPAALAAHEADDAGAMPTPVPTAAVEPETEVDSEQTTKPPAQRVADIRVEASGGGYDIVVVPADGRIATDRIRTEDLVAPRRILVRIRAVTEPYRPYEMPVGTGEIQRLRIGFHPGNPSSELWVVGDLEESSALAVAKVIADGDGIRVELRAR